MNFRKIILLLTLMLLSFQSQAARFAMVMSKKALVYADKELKSPIGYIVAGKKIMIGEVERKRGSIVPIVVAGRIAWIQVADISIDRESYKTKSEKTTTRFAVSEEEFRDKNEVAEDTLFNNNHFFLSYSLDTMTMSFKEFEETLEGTDNLAAVSLNVEVEHRSPFQRSAWSIGLSYHKQVSENFEWSTFIGRFTYNYSLIKSKLLALDVFLGGLITGDFKFQNPSYSDAGTALGYRFGGQIKLFPFSKMGFVLGASQQNLSINDLPSIELTSNQNLTLDNVFGISVYGGITWKL